MIQWVIRGWMLEERTRHKAVELLWILLLSWKTVSSWELRAGPTESGPGSWWEGKTLCTRLAHRLASSASAVWVLALLSLPLWPCFNAHQPRFQILILNLTNSNWHNICKRAVGQPGPTPGLKKPQSTRPSSVLALSFSSAQAQITSPVLTFLLSKPWEGGRGCWSRVWKLRVGYDCGLLACSSLAPLSHSRHTPPRTRGRGHWRSLYPAHLGHRDDHYLDRADGLKQNQKDI